MVSREKVSEAVAVSSVEHVGTAALEAGDRARAASAIRETPRRARGVREPRPRFSRRVSIPRHASRRSSRVTNHPRLF